MPTFWMMMRKTTLLLMDTGVFVGLNKVFVTFTAALLMRIVTLLETLVAVLPLAVAAFVAVPMASVVKVTVMFVLWPGEKAPRFVHVNKPDATESGARLAEE